MDLFPFISYLSVSVPCHHGNIKTMAPCQSPFTPSLPEPVNTHSSHFHASLQSGTREAKNKPNLKGGEQTTLGSSIRKRTMRRKGRDKEEWKGWMHEAYLIWQKWSCKSQTYSFFNDMSIIVVDHWNGFPTNSLQTTNSKQYWLWCN